jgi:hypothetical protein
MIKLLLLAFAVSPPGRLHQGFSNWVGSMPC